MRPTRRIVPSVLLLLLSALGILIPLLAAAGLIFWINQSAAESSPLTNLALLSGACLAVLIALLNVPTLYYLLRYLAGRQVTVNHRSLLRPAVVFGMLWVLVLAAGMAASNSEPYWSLLAPLSVLGVALPAWLLVELGRRGLARTTALREWGTLTIGLSAAPFFIMLMEIILVIAVVLVVLLLVGFNSPLFEQLMALPQQLDQTSQGMEALENLLSILFSEPLITAAVFLIVGFIAPLIEELIKPLAVWLLLNRPLAEREGFMLGLVSGGAFALLESASLVSQIDPTSWLPAVALRSATAVLHIGLSGMLGYGITYAWNHKSIGTAARYLFSAVGLHGLWNAMALVSGFSAISATSVALKITLTDILPLFFMGLIFMLVVLMVNRINRLLRTQQSNPQQNP